MTGTTDSGTSASFTTISLIDLMTSLAIVFILLFATISTQATSQPQSPLKMHQEDVQATLHQHLDSLGLSLDADPQDPMTLFMVVPDQQLTFEFGRSALSPQAVRFLQEAMPFYAAALCGPLRNKIDSLAIQGHTDAQGDDIYNLQLSQERSLAVMVKALEVIQAHVPSAYQCFQEMTSTSGRGRQDLVYAADHKINHEQSRRVIFKIRLRSVEQRNLRAQPPKHSPSA